MTAPRPVNRYNGVQIGIVPKSPKAKKSQGETLGLGTYPSELDFETYLSAESAPILHNPINRYRYYYSKFYSFRKLKMHFNSIQVHLEDNLRQVTKESYPRGARDGLGENNASKPTKNGHRFD